MPHDFVKLNLSEKIILEAFVEFKDNNGKK